VRRDVGLFAVVVVAAVVAAAPTRAGAAPCPPEMPGGCRGFVRGGKMTLAAVLGSGLDASPIKAVGVTPDGKTGYGLRGDGALDAWDLATGALRRVAIARFVALDPAGHWAIASQARKGEPDRDWSERGSGLELWDLTTRRRVGTTKVEWQEPLDVVFSARRIFVSGSMGSDLDSLVWDTATGKTRDASEPVYERTAALTPDGTRAVCVGGAGDEEHDGGGVLLWDLDRRRVVRRLPIPSWEEKGQITGLAVSPDGKKALVMLSHGDYSARTSLVWNLESGRVDKGPEANARGAVRWSADGRSLIMLGSEGYPGVALIPAVGAAGKDKDKPKAKDPAIWLGDDREGAKDAVFLPDGKRVLTGDTVGVMHLLDASDARELRVSRALSGHTAKVLSLSVSRDGKRMLSYGEDTTLKVWDLQSNRPIKSIALDTHNEHKGALMTPDGAFAVAGLKGLGVIKLPEGTLRQTLVLVGPTLWEIPSGREVWSTSSSAWYGAAAFSADQRHVYAAASYKVLVDVIDAASGVVQATVGQRGRYAQSPGLALAVDPHETFVLIEPDGWDADVKVEGEHNVVARLDLPSGRVAWKVAIRHYAHQLAVSPDGRWFVAVGPMHFAHDPKDMMKRYPARVELRATADGAVVDAVDLESADLEPLAAAFLPDGSGLIIGTDHGPILRFSIAP
jgi:WD40 repeat protein